MAYNFAVEVNSARSAGILGRVVRAIARARIIGRDTRQLLELPDYRLKDLGITHSDVPRVVRHGRI